MRSSCSCDERRRLVWRLQGAPSLDPAVVFFPLGAKMVDQISILLQCTTRVFHQPEPDSQSTCSRCVLARVSSHWFPLLPFISRVDANDLEFLCCSDVAFGDST